MSFREPGRSRSSHEPLRESAGGQVAQSPHAPPAAPEGEVSAGEASLQSEVPGAPGLSWWPSAASLRHSQTGLQLSLCIWCVKKMGSYLSIPAYFTSRDPFR